MSLQLIDVVVPFWDVHGGRGEVSDTCAVRIGIGQVVVCRIDLGERVREFDHRGTDEETVIGVG